jgi:hypothetical protein
MTRRVRILIDDQRYALLEREATATGQPIAELICDAIDSRYGIDLAARHAAYHRILAAKPMPVDDWEVMKGEGPDEVDDRIAANHDIAERELSRRQNQRAALGG